MSGRKKEKHHMIVDEVGKLENITRSGGQRGRPGSKPPQSGSKTNTASSTSTRLHSNMASSLELLTPEEVQSQRDYDCELEDYGSGASLTDSDADTELVMDTGRTSELFGIVEPPGGKNNNNVQQMQVEDVDDEDYMLTRQIALFDDEDSGPDDVSSGEERDIIKEIKAEITKNVKEEMAKELEDARRKRERERQGGDENADLAADMDPKLREAYIKMRRLDKLLAKKIRKEKEVKRERILLQRSLKKQLESVKSTGRELKEVTTNTMKFLALTCPISHNQGVNVEDEIPEELDAESEAGDAVPPVFQTQPPPMDDTESTTSTERSSHKNGMKNKNNSRKGSDATQHTSRSGESQHSAKTTSTNHTTSTTDSNGRRKKKNFIKRNIKLAGDAANAIAMTDEEKKLLDTLLVDVDDMPDDDLISSKDGSVYTQQLSIVSGQGFKPDNHEMRDLANIDEQLRRLMPPEDFQSITSSTPTASPTQMSIFTRSTRAILDDDYDGLGDEVLRQTKEERAMTTRLREIEEELNHITHLEKLEVVSPTLSEQQLNDLLDGCARTMCITAAESDTDSVVTARSTGSRVSLMEHPPKLPNHVLQQLLEDAREHGIVSSSRINHSDSEHSTDSEAEGGDGDEELVEEGYNRAIRNGRRSENGGGSQNGIDGRRSKNIESDSGSPNGMDTDRTHSAGSSSRSSRSTIHDGVNNSNSLKNTLLLNGRRSRDGNDLFSPDSDRPNSSGSNTVINDEDHQELLREQHRMQQIQREAWQQQDEPNNQPDRDRQPFLPPITPSPRANLVNIRSYDRNPVRNSSSLSIRSFSMDDNSGTEATPTATPQPPRDPSPPSEPRPTSGVRRNIAPRVPSPTTDPRPSSSGRRSLSSRNSQAKLTSSDEMDR